MLPIGTLQAFMLPQYLVYVVYFEILQSYMFTYNSIFSLNLIVRLIPFFFFGTIVIEDIQLPVMVGLDVLLAVSVII